MFHVCDDTGIIASFEHADDAICYADNHEGTFITDPDNDFDDDDDFYYDDEELTYYDEEMATYQPWDY